MHRGLRPYIAAAALTAASACTTPHHSNALIFGTNTNFGIDVGQTATGVPSILVGYRRQEAVFMPLVANVAYDENGVPQPCDVYPGAVENLTGATSGQTGRLKLREIPPCFLVGQHDNALDTYSVLASFGAEFSARAGSPEVGGGLAQFFATGLAAQALVIRGGSSLVAVSQAAGDASRENSDAAIAALYDAPVVTQRVTEIEDALTAAQVAIGAYLETHTTAEDFPGELQALENSAKSQGLLTFICDGLDRTACLKAIRGTEGRRALLFSRADWNTAIHERKTAKGIN
jgi:hypothetical protein